MTWPSLTSPLLDLPPSPLLHPTTDSWTQPLLKFHDFDCVRQGKLILLWHDLEQLKVTNCAWIWMGDFNCVLNMDKRLEAPVRNSEVLEFRRCVNSFQMEDMKASGRFFTWNNKQSDEDRVFSYNDWVMCNNNWVEAYQYTEAHLLPKSEFDHNPMFLI